VSKIRYCKNCKQKVKPIKKFSWLIFILGLLAFGVGALLYLIYYYIIKKSTRCPICGVKTKGWLWQLRHKGLINNG